MKVKIVLPLLIILITGFTVQGQLLRGRQKISFDQDWKFHFGHAGDPAMDFNFRIANIFSKSGKAETTAIDPKFNDQDWKTLSLPHDWAVELPFINSPDFDVQSHGYKPVGGRYPETSIGWYRKHFTVKKADSGQRFTLQFDGVFRDAKFWLNGFYLGTNESGYIGISFDITDYISFDRDNVVVVRVDASQYEGWFYEGAGIYRHVWLNRLNDLHVAENSLFISSEVKDKQAAVKLEAKIENYGLESVDFSLVFHIADRKNKVLAGSSEQSFKLEAGKNLTVKNLLELNDPVVWSPDNPYLYKAFLVVKSKGIVHDSLAVRFGVMTIEFDAEKGFFLNGRNIKIQGVCCHQDHAGVGSALPDHLQYYRIRLLKEMGVNAYRTSHNAPTPELLDACDSLGMLVLDEQRLLNSSPEYLSQFDRLICRDRNHPSVFLWSIGNEEGYVQTNGIGKRIAQSLINRQKDLDPTRTSTYGADLPNFYTGINEVIPIRGFNYRQSAVVDYHKTHPAQPIIGTEMGSTVTTRGIYEKDTIRCYLPDQDITAPWWASKAEEWWKLCASQPWFMGGFTWTGFDYRGEPTPFQWPNINSHFGIMDMCGFPKNIYYYYQSWWTDKDVLHISPHWNWKGSERKIIPVWVNSNADRVELFLNGNSLGEKEMPRNGHLEWSVSYIPGILKAVAQKNGRKFSSSVETTDQPYRVIAVPDQLSLLSDGKDATVINIHVVDRLGREVPDACNLIQFSVKGDAKMIGTGNGDPSSHEPDKCSENQCQRKLFNGKCQVILQSGKTAGPVRFVAGSEGLIPCRKDIRITGYQQPHPSTGYIRRLENFPSKYVSPRNIDIWLPEGYDPEKKYAVLYMHDGQMLFDSSATWNKQEWGIDETLGRLMASKKIRDCIVVGVWNAGEQRHEEYTPQKAFNSLPARDRAMILSIQNNNRPILGKGPVSDNYLKFLVYELKPFIDSSFSVMGDQQNTFISGSSMGGLISLYAICEYPGIFGGAACLSTHWPGIFRAENNPVPAALLKYMKDHLPSPDNHKIYFDYGTETLDALYEPFQKQADMIMKEKGFSSENWMTRKFNGDDHSERAWNRRFSIPAEFLLGKMAGNPGPPEWSKNAVWYQIFVERFNNGDKSNDPGPENIRSDTSYIVPDDWKLSDWNQDWDTPSKEEARWMKESGKNFGYILQLRRFGGDLQGVMDKLDYLSDLGINAIYLNPVNDAPSLHKYDARSYHHIDVNFGPDPAGDNKLIASEIPDDPSTWKWTSADKLFLRLVEEVHKRKMHLIVDYSWNHTGTEFWAWKDLVKNQEKSRYRDWYEIISFDDPSTPGNEFRYKGWADVKGLPEIKKVDVTTTRRNGYPYEGEINPGAKRYIFDVTQRWLAPDGDISRGIDGFRLDVADQVPMGFWRDFNRKVKSINPDAYLVGEIWWARWPDTLMNPVPYVNDSIFDAIMFYQIYRPAKYFFSKTDFPLDARQFKDSLLYQWNRLPEPFRYGMMNVSATHDSPRLLTCFNNPGKYKFNAKRADDPLYKTGKPDAETYIRVKLYLVHQFTNVGAPHIWNGDELGMWGGDDPDCRKPLSWNGYDQEYLDFYRKLISIRKENPVLSNGDISFISAKGKTLAYERFNEESRIIVVFNLGSSPVLFDLPEKTDYQNLLDSTQMCGKTITLNPLTAVILKKR